MNHRILLTCMIMIFAFPAHKAMAGDDHAVDHEEIVIALSIDDFELNATDLSDMEVGDAKTYTSQSGKRIDLLRTEHGVEIYVDGELIEVGAVGDDLLHEGHRVHNARVEVICESEDDCERTVWIGDEGDIDVHIDHEVIHHEEGHHKVIIIEKEVDSD